MLLNEEDISLVLEILKKNNKTVVINEAHIQQMSFTLQPLFGLLADTLQESASLKNHGRIFIQLLHLLMSPIRINIKASNGVSAVATNAMSPQNMGLKKAVSEILEGNSGDESVLKKICDVMRTLLYAVRENDLNYNLCVAEQDGSKNNLQFSKILIFPETNNEPTAEEIKTVFLIYVQLKMMELIQNPSVFPGFEVEPEDRVMGFWLACECGYTPVVDFLLHRNSIKEIMNDKLDDGATPFLVACERGHVGVVKLLTEANVDITVKMPDGKTGLVLAHRQNHIPVVEFLMKENQKKLSGTVSVGGEGTPGPAYFPSQGTEPSGSDSKKQEDDDEDFDLNNHNTGWCYTQ